MRSGQRGQQPGGPVGLGDAGLVQLDVRGALEAALQVPGRLAVPPQHYPGPTAAR